MNPLVRGEAFRPVLWRGVIALRRQQWVEISMGLQLAEPVLTPQTHFAQPCRRWNLCGRCVAPTQTYTTGSVSDSWGTPHTLPPCFAKNEATTISLRRTDDRKKPFRPQAPLTKRLRPSYSFCSAVSSRISFSYALPSLRSTGSRADNVNGKGRRRLAATRCKIAGG